MASAHSRSRGFSGADVWRIILKWIGPETPGRGEENEGLVLGVVVMLVLTISLPYLFGILLAR